MTVQQNIERQTSRFQLLQEGFTPLGESWVSGYNPETGSYNRHAAVVNETPSGFAYYFNGSFGEGSTFSKAREAFDAVYEEFRLSLG